ncbi:MAG: extracellular solute-binding protein [Deltaproteobacteria bacterium]|nr:extracellular solute-binding protein [Deltaproteobacteria bacterium]PWB61988.1 MAG: sugar ABC transporter substrate-binding protein [Deltaproteobacteria bacterium]
MKRKTAGLSRREFMKAAGFGAAAAGLGVNILLPRNAHAAKKTLRILQWNHFVPAYDKWFNNTYTKEWGQKNDTEVIVDNIGLAGINSRAAAEVSAKKGHDLFMFLWPPPVYEDQVIDHTEIYQECERKYGKAIPLAIKSTFNPKTKKYFGFSDSYVPDPINYRTDLWGDVGVSPDTWDNMRVGGRKIKEKHKIPLGIGLSSEIDTGMAMRAILYSFGGSVQDERGNLVLGSKNTLEAVKFVKAMYAEAMSPEVFSWDASSNNRAMLAGTVSAVLNAISVTREAENKQMDIHKRIGLAKAAQGPVRRIGLEHVMDVYVIWKFAENIEGAKKFLVDYIGNFRQGFLASEYYNFPCFPKQVPDLEKLISHDPKASPPDKYKVLADVLTWATNVGYPGYANAAIDEVFSTWVLNTMFAEAAYGKETPENALKKAEARCREIWAKWKQKGAL